MVTLVLCPVSGVYVGQLCTNRCNNVSVNYADELTLLADRHGFKSEHGET